MSLLRRPDFDIPLNHKKNLSLQLFNLSLPFGISKWNTSAQHQSPADKGGTSGVTSTIPSFRGSLTLEAALALSLFLFVCTTFLMIFPAMQVQFAIRQAAEQTAEEVAVLSSIPLADSLAAALPDGWGNEAAHLAGNGAGTLYLRERILQLADRDRLNTSWIRGGSSGVLILAEFPAENESKEDIVIHWLYAVNFTALPGVSLPVSGQVCRRMWTGSVRQNAERDVESDNIVYVAENGKVCHRSRDCTYLKLSVKSAGLDEIPALRNQDGAKYYPCERCVLHGECSSPVYITEEGNRYHVDSNCGGLRRMVDSVPAGETSLPLCSRCGGGS